MSGCRSRRHWWRPLTTALRGVGGQLRTKPHQLCPKRKGRCHGERAHCLPNSCACHGWTKATWRQGLRHCVSLPRSVGTRLASRRLVGSSLSGVAWGWRSTLLHRRCLRQALQSLSPTCRSGLGWQLSPRLEFADWAQAPLSVAPVVLLRATDGSDAGSVTGSRIDLDSLFGLCLCPSLFLEHEATKRKERGANAITVARKPEQSRRLGSILWAWCADCAIAAFLRTVPRKARLILTAMQTKDLLMRASNTTLVSIANVRIMPTWTSPRLRH